VATIERALELDDDPERRARLLALQAIELVYEHDHRHRRELAEQALRLAREVGNPRTTARVLIAYFLIHFAPDVLERRTEQLEELCKTAHAAADPALEFWAAFAELNVMVESGDLERAEKTAQRMTAIAEVDEPTIRWAAVGIARASMALLRGDLAEAERYAKQAL
jgi:tetratricopeptide (TPR) repeat protein